jgi:hypothetical protein
MSDAERKPENPPNLSNISVFMRDESLAGFVSRNAGVDRARFLTKHPYPVLLTSMPTQAELTTSSILIPLKKKKQPKARGTPFDKTATRISAKDISKQNAFSIGRDPGCDIVFAPKSLSRRHALVALRAEDGLWTVMDLGSSNGTLLGGRRIPPQQVTPVPHSPIRLDLGPDVQVHFVLPDDLYTYVSHFADERAATPHMPFPTKSSSSERLSTLTPRPDDDLEHEGGSTRFADPGETQDDLLAFGPAASEPRAKTPSGPIPTNIDRDIENRLLKTVQTLAALDALILTVVAQLKTDPRPVPIYSSEKSGRVVDVAEQLVRLGPLLKQVFVTLSVGDGKPIEVYPGNA